jgi:uncharacterized protein (UPF0332 family)
MLGGLLSYLDKAREHFEAALLLYSQGFNNDAISRLYYSFRSIALFIVGKPERGKWRHGALMRKVVMEVDRRELIPLTREERRLIKDFASVREDADYELVKIPDKVVDSYIKLVRKFLEEIGGVKGRG